MSSNTFIKELFGWIKSLIGAVILALIINIFIFELSIVDGHSMDPTLHDKDKVFSLKTNYLLNLDLDYGDIVIIDSDLDHERTLKDEILDSAIVRNITKNQGNEFWVKRIIGKSGDLLEIKSGKVYRNGELLKEIYIKEDMTYKDKSFSVPKNHIFVMGDNRNNSNDSRYIGPVPYDNVRGKVVFRLFPFDDITKF